MFSLVCLRFSCVLRLVLFNVCCFYMVFDPNMKLIYVNKVFVKTKTKKKTPKFTAVLTKYWDMNTHSLKFSTAPAFTSNVLKSKETQTVCWQVRNDEMLFTYWAGISTELVSVMVRCLNNNTVHDNTHRQHLTYIKMCPHVNSVKIYRQITRISTNLRSSCPHHITENASLPCSQRNQECDQ